jgi:hypothetical protein
MTPRETLLAQRVECERDLDFWWSHRYSDCGATRVRELKGRMSSIDRALGELSDDALREREYREMVMNAVAPVKTIRSWIRASAERLGELLIIGRKCVIRAYGNDSARVEQGVLIGPGATSEETLADMWHEGAHLLDPQADGRQHRYVYHASTNTIISPRAEVAAWRFAIEHACFITPAGMKRAVWTLPMQNRMSELISTYRAHATPPEEEAIVDIVTFGFKRVTPAPDSFEGRVQRAAQIRREMKATRIESELFPRRERAEERLRVLGLP